MKNKSLFSISLLILISLIPLIDLLHPGLPLTHDGQDHVARIANFYTNLQDGNLIPRWAPNLNWGYGHPILMFLYPLPSYAASVFHALGFSLVDSAKLVFALAYVGSAVTMFLWTKNIFGIYGGFAASILYLFAPYRFVDLYVRGAIGEHVAFIFGPLICYFLYKLIQKFNRWYVVGGTLSISGLLLSHNAVSIMFLPFIVFYSLYLIASSIRKRQLIYQYTSILVLGFGISAFFWIPAFAEGKYTLRDIVTSKEYISRFVEFKDFLYGLWSYGGSADLSKQVGVIHWIFIALFIPLLLIMRKNKRKERIVLATLLLFFASSLFLMMEASSTVWKTLSTLQKFQFPWRFLTLSVFTSSLIGGLVVGKLPKKIGLLAVIGLVPAILFVNQQYFHAQSFLMKPEGFYSGIYNGTTDTGESSPIWSVRFMEKRPIAPIEVIDGKAQIEIKKRSSTSHEYTITANKRSRMKENTLYFPGWVVLVDGKEVAVEFQDQQNRGLITFFVEEGKHTVMVIFRETKLRMISNLVSLFSLIGIVLLLLKPRYGWNK